MNRLYGFRISKAFESEERWFSINSCGGKQLIIWAVPLILWGVVCFFIPIDDQSNGVLAFVLGLGPIAVCTSIVIAKTCLHSKKL